MAPESPRRPPPVGDMPAHGAYRRLQSLRSSARISFRSRTYSGAADQRRRCPRVRREDLLARMNLQPLLGHRRDGELSVLIDDHQRAVGIDHLSSGERPIPPDLLSGIGVQRDHERRPEVAARADDEVADSDRAAEVEAHPVVRPELFRLRAVR